MDTATMPQELALQPAKSFFLNLEPGTTVRLFIPNQDIPSFLWMHDRVERDLMYGSLEFEGHSEVFPVQAYLYDTGTDRGISLSVGCFNSSAKPDTPISFQGHTSIFLSAPLPSQYPAGRSGPSLKLNQLSESELDVFDAFQKRMQNAGFRVCPYISSAPELSVTYRKNQLKGCVDFEVHKGPLRAGVSIRKHKPGGMFSKALWRVSVDDSSNRCVQPHGWGRDGIMITPGSTSILNHYDLHSVNAVIDTLTDCVDKLVIRNR